MFLGYNPQIKAGKLYLEAMGWFAPIKKEAPVLKISMNKKPVTKVQTATLATIRAHNGGEGEIRTRGTLTDTPVFKTGPFNHSGTSPVVF